MIEIKNDSARNLKRGRGRPRAFNSVDELVSQIKAYFEDQEKQDIPPTILGLALWLKLSRETLSQYARGAYDDDLNKYSDAIGMARDAIEQDKLLGGLSGKYNCKMVIFDLMNNHGYRKHTHIHKAAPSALPDE